MKIFLTGSSGFIGSHLKKFFLNKYKVLDVDLRKLDGNYNLNNLTILSSVQKNDVIINCAASLRPKSKLDFYINSKFPILLIKYLKKKKLNNKFIHLSSLNVTVGQMKDSYSLSKKKCEKLIKSKNVIILRLPLIIKKNRKNELLSNGALSIFFKYLNFDFLPIYPMVYPGNYYNPIEINKIAKFIFKLIKTNKIKKIYNLSGEIKFSTWDLFKRIANKKNKRVVKIQTKYLKKVLPKSFMKIVYKYNFLNNLLGNIDFEKYLKLNKTVL